MSKIVLERYSACLVAAIYRRRRTGVALLCTNRKHGLYINDAERRKEKEQEEIRDRIRSRTHTHTRLTALLNALEEIV